MSRIGKLPIQIYPKVEIVIESDRVLVKGPKGELSQKLHRAIQLEQRDDFVYVYPASFKNSQSKETQTVEKEVGALWGLYRSLVANMVQGVTEGYHKKLLIEGVGYRAQMEGNKLVLTLGFSHLIEFPVPEGIQVEVKGNAIEVSGIDKHLVGQVAANIRKFRKPEPYKGKGIRYEGEFVRRKVGKKAAT
jgi:large subunit ribosomal protein L6